MRAEGADTPAFAQMEVGLLTAADTVRLGEALAPCLYAGCTVALYGRIGAGKTTLVQGLAHGLGMPSPAQSPTFTIVAEHTGGRLPLYHIDLYRLEESAARELDMLDEYLYGDGVCAVEWARWIEDALPADRLDIRLQDGEAGHCESADGRVAIVRPTGVRSSDALERWWRAWRS